jgi:predicted ATP-grasp superfamily ATP-dependent carboligase
MKRLPEKQNSGAMIIGGDFHGLGIVRNLSGSVIPIYVVHPGLCIARFSIFTDDFFKSPPLEDGETFVQFLIDLAGDKKLANTVLFPVSDKAVHILSKHREILSRHYLVPTPEWEVTRQAYDKRYTYQLAREIGVPIPRTFFPENADDLAGLPFNFPVILKPSVTANFYPVTQLKAIRADSHDELMRHYFYMSSVIDSKEIMVQEIIPGGPKNLYSFCSLFADGIVKAKIMAVRLRQHPMDFGSSSTYVITCCLPELETLATQMLQGMKYYGLSEVEFMFDENDRTFKLLDINPRTWAWHTLGAAAGVNFAALLFQDMHNNPASVESFETGVKWIREVTDIPVALSEILAGRLKLVDYFRSLKGKKEWAVSSVRDPLPLLAELLFMPYLWYKRGFRM